VGVGFGPSNLALAIALAERPDPARAVFLEGQESFGWHRGMLLEDATMQISFLKDLVTPRNPSSSFGFLAYLHERDRLADFINHKVLFPSRVEFHDYLDWAAAAFREQVEYGTWMTGIRPVRYDGQVRYWDVIAAKAGHERVWRTRNIVLATGITPVLPETVRRSERVWHSNELLERLRDLPPHAGLRFAVVGAGQSAAEVAVYLHGHYLDAEVHLIMSRYGYSAADDTPFANRIFDPEAIDVFFSASADVKRKFYAYHSGTNYSVADVDVINELYRRYYLEKVRGRTRLQLVNMADVTQVAESVGENRPGVTLKLETPSSPAITGLDVDVAVFATGYAPMNPLDLLGQVASHCQVDDLGHIRVDRDYRVVTASDVQAGIFLQGGTEDTHGISASLLSNVAVRAGEICAATFSDSGQVGCR
jgi:L-ornithine N5-oxygenase